MVDIPADQSEALRAALDELQRAGTPQAKELAAILRIEDPGALCVEYCLYADKRLSDPGAQVSRYEDVANLVDRCHYDLVCGGLSKIVEHFDEIPYFIDALVEVGAAETASVLRQLRTFLERVPAADWETADADREIMRFGSELDVEESWRALVGYLDRNRFKLATTR